MAEFLFGMECIAATLLWIGLFAAWSARSRRWWVTLLAMALSLLLLALWSGVILLEAFLFHPVPYRSLPFNVLTSFLFATCVGAVWIWIKSRRRAPDGERNGSSWNISRLAFAAIVVTLLAQSTLLMLDSQARDRLIDVRREGEALAQSLAPRPLLDSENAAVLYRRVFDATRADDFPPTLHKEEVPSTSELDDYPQEPDVPDFRTYYWAEVVSRAFQDTGKDSGEINFKSPRLIAFLERQSGIRRIWLDAAKIPGCNFNRDFARPSYAMLLPELNGLRSGARFLAIDARVAAERGDTARAAEDISAMWRLADHTSQEPLLISSLVGFAIEKIARDALLSILGTTLDNADPLVQLQLPNRESPVIEMERNMRLEEAASLLLLSNLDLGLDSRRDELFVLQRTDTGPGEMARLSLSVTGPLARVLFLPDMATDARDSFNRFASFRGQWNQLTPEFFERLKTLDSNPPRTPLVRLILPAATATFKNAIRTEMHRRLLRVALGLYRYYHAPGPEGRPRRAFPDYLAALVPDYVEFVPSDLFNSGRPLSFRTTETGCVVYSFGFNFVDDQGVDSETSDGLGTELVIECLDPAKSRAAKRP